MELVQCFPIISDRVESSTYFQKFVLPMTSRSFIIVKNNQGPSLVPCGTLVGTVFHSDKQSSLSLTRCLRSVIKSNIQSKVVLGISYFASLSIKLRSYDQPYRRPFESQKELFWLRSRYRLCFCSSYVTY